MNRVNTTIYWAVIYCSSAVLLQCGYRYYFFYAEQLQIFLFDGQYAADAILQPGGTALYMARFTVQFFALPFVGALWTALLLTAVGVLTKRVLDSVAVSPANYLLSILPSCLLIYAHTDVNYNTQGTFACLMILAAMTLYLRIKSFNTRLILTIALIPALFLLAGAAASLFAMLAMLSEIFLRNKRWWIAASGYSALIAIIVYISQNLGWQSDIRLIIMPDAYSDPLIRDHIIYFLWMSFPFALILAAIFRRNSTLNKHTKIIIAVQLVLLCALLMSDTRQLIFTSMEQDYYLRNRQWDKIIDTFRPERSNLQMTNVLNLALAEKGLLGEQIFARHPVGTKSILAEWDNTQFNAIALSDIYYSIGDIATAQKLAFEGNVSSLNEGNVRLLERLVQTNIIFAEYAVALKYITVLEQTLFYGKKARAYKKLISSGAIVMQDAEIKNKRKALSNGGEYAVSNSPMHTFELLAGNNPQATLPMQYMLAMTLTGRDLKTFRRLMEQYFRTPILPVLGKNHQEAVIALAQDDPGYWIKHGVSTEVEKHFRSFDSEMRQRKLKSLDAKMQSDFGDTFWFYLLSK